MKPMSELQRAIRELLEKLSLPTVNLCPASGSLMGQLVATFFFQAVAYEVPLPICMTCEPEILARCADYEDYDKA
jgi:hypothetical protein